MKTLNRKQSEMREQLNRMYRRMVNDTSVYS
jgi:hypothetical protein